MGEWETHSFVLKLITHPSPQIQLTSTRDRGAIFASLDQTTHTATLPTKDDVRRSRKAVSVAAAARATAVSGGPGVGHTGTPEGEKPGVRRRARTNHWLRDSSPAR